MRDSTGEQGATGAPGVAGRQGEAGVSGPEGLPGKTGLSGRTGHAGEAGEIGPPGRRGRSFSAGQVLAVFAFVVLAFVVLSIRTEVQQRQISHNADRIAQLQHADCTVRRADIVRQNALIDSAVQAERRKPVPDPKRIADLTAFRGTVPNCGPRPR